MLCPECLGASAMKPTVLHGKNVLFCVNCSAFWEEEPDDELEQEEPEYVAVAYESGYPDWKALLANGGDDLSCWRADCQEEP